MFVGVILSVMNKFFGHIHSVMLIRSNDYSSLTSLSYTPECLAMQLGNGVLDLVFIFYLLFPSLNSRLTTAGQAMIIVE